MESQLTYAVPPWNLVLAVFLATFAMLAGTVALKRRTAQDVRNGTSRMFEPVWMSNELLSPAAPATAAAPGGRGRRHPRPPRGHRVEQLEAVPTVMGPGTAQGLVIPWSKIDFPLYNTVMAIAAGAGLLLVVDLGRRLRIGQTFQVEGYSLALLTNGILLTTTGLHMSLTWPLASGGFAYDNIIFGEPALVFGVMQLVGALGLWLRRDLIGTASPERERAIGWLLGPSSVLGVGIGLGCFGIAAAGVRYQLWVAPPEEPISGSVFGQWPWFEITFIAGLYVLTGLGAVLLPLAVRSLRGPWSVVVGICWALAGLAFLLFGAFNYFSHIGLIINTTASG